MSAGVGSELAGTEDELRELYEAHAGLVFGYVLKLTRGNRTLAEDIVQETLLRAWQHPEARDPRRGSTRSWLCTVARNLVIDDARARRVRPQEAGVDELDAQVADPDGERAFDQALTAWEMRDAFTSLSVDHRAVLIEIYYRGHTVAETAKTIGVPEGTVKSRAFYALRALRLACEERGIRP